jgi:hypothetical protein
VYFVQLGKKVCRCLCAFFVRRFIRTNAASGTVSRYGAVMP